jgi:pantothenate kinase
MAVEALDERIWIEIRAEVARERLIRRHLSEGVEYTEEDARHRGVLLFTGYLDFQLTTSMQPS